MGKKKGTKNDYDPHLKLIAVSNAINNPRDVEKIAARYHISTSELLLWKQQFIGAAFAAFDSNKEGGTYYRVFMPNSNDYLPNVYNVQSLRLIVFQIIRMIENDQLDNREITKKEFKEIKSKLESLSDDKILNNLNDYYPFDQIQIETSNKPFPFDEIEKDFFYLVGDWH